MGLSPSAVLSTVYTPSSRALNVGLTTANTLTLTNATTTDALTINQSGVANAIYVNQTAADVGVLVKQTAAAACIEIDNDSTAHGIYIHLDGTLGASQRGLYIDTVAAQTGSGARLCRMSASNASDSIILVEFAQYNAGATSTILNLDQNATGNAITLNIDSSSTSGDAINIDAVNTSGTVVDINSTAAASAAIVLSVRQDAADATGDCCELWNDGTGNCLSLVQTADCASSHNALRVYSNAVVTTSPLCYMQLANTSATQVGLFIDHHSGNYAFRIDTDCSTAGQIFAMLVECDNAGAGSAGGIDLGSFSAGEHVFKLPADNTSIDTTTVASTGRVAIDIAGATRYLAYWS